MNTINDKELTYRQNCKVTWVGVFTNLVLSIFKIMAGIIGTSQAIVADGIHSLSDLITDAMALVGLKYAHKPKDKEHPYGHGKIENIASGFIALILIMAGVHIFYKGANTIFSERLQFEPGILPLIAAVISIISKEILFRYTMFQGRRSKSSVLIANAWHHRSDVWSSIATLFGVIGARLGYLTLDPIAACFVSIFIFILGLRIGKQSFDILIESSISHDMTTAIADKARSVDGVLGIHDIKGRHIGVNIALEIHIEVNPNITVAEGHRIVERVREVIKAEFGNIDEIVAHLDVTDDRGE